MTILNALKNGRLAVYTVVTNGYDRLTPLAAEKDTDYICFTDRIADSIPAPWRQVLLENPDGLCPERLARLPKVSPEAYLTGYGASAYLDGNVRVAGSIRDYIMKNAGDGEILLVRHRKYDCAYEAIEDAFLSGCDYESSLYSGRRALCLDGFPSHRGHYDTGVIVRAHGNDAVLSMQREWNTVVMEHTFLDALSLPYALWKADVMPQTVDAAVFAERFRKAKHRKRPRKRVFMPGAKRGLRGFLNRLYAITAGRWFS